MLPAPKALTITALATLLTLASQDANASDRTRYFTVEEQRTAILDCRHDMGLRGKSRFGGEWPETPIGGQTVIWITPGPNLSHADADRINICADEALGRNASPMFGPGVTKVTYSACPPGAATLFGGATYCIGNH